MGSRELHRRPSQRMKYRPNEVTGRLGISLRVGVFDEPGRDREMLFEEALKS
jgi:hypothetical protein